MRMLKGFLRVFKNSEKMWAPQIFIRSWQTISIFKPYSTMWNDGPIQKYTSIYVNKDAHSVILSAKLLRTSVCIYIHINIVKRWYVLYSLPCQMMLE